MFNIPTVITVLILFLDLTTSTTATAFVIIVFPNQMPKYSIEMSKLSKLHAYDYSTRHHWVARRETREKNSRLFLETLPASRQIHRVERPALSMYAYRKKVIHITRASQIASTHSVAVKSRVGTLGKMFAERRVNLAKPIFTYCRLTCARMCCRCRWHTFDQVCSPLQPREI